MEENTGPPKPPQDFHFVTAVYKRISSSVPKDENIAFSPLLLRSTLHLGKDAFKGDIQKVIEMKLALLQVAPETENIKKTLDHLKNVKDASILIGNNVFVKKINNAKINGNFEATAKEIFGFEVEAVKSFPDFNEWVRERISESVPVASEDLLDNSSSSGVAVFSAIRLNGDWFRNFPREEQQNFQISPNKTIEVQMMNMYDTFFYDENVELDASVMGIRYKDQENLRMYVILPNEHSSIDELEMKLCHSSLREVLQHARYQFIGVDLPKFKINTITDFAKVLEMDKVFEATSTDFSSILESEDKDLSVDLSIRNIIQAVAIEVNEQGEVPPPWDPAIPRHCSGVVRALFRVDRPAIFLVATIKDDDVEDIAIYGRLSKPRF